MKIESLRNTISELCSISAPSGYEYSIIQYLRNKLKYFADIDIKEDILGNLIVIKKGTCNDKTIMFVAHCDEIGFSVKYIDDSGFIRFSSIGGVDLSLLKGITVSVIHKSNYINGVIGAKPMHWGKNTSGKEITLEDVWIDIGTKSKEEALELVSIGDAISFRTNFIELNNNLFSSKSIDNRAGVVTLLAVLEKLQHVKVKNNLAFVFSVQEEIGLRGAITAGYNVHPDICIAIDVTHATDYPSINKNAHGDIRVNLGPVIPIGANFNHYIQEQLRELADKNHILYQVESLPSNSGTDLAELQLIKGGCKTGLVSIPCRYMHTPIEIASYEDIDKTIELLQCFIMCQ